ncbi:MAG: oxygen-independent coproporphyrinogen III oxidase [Candidatus Lindowbacteria bacterium RIFCSPLOWO2_12_FULL_62_27]|nr:MAG: oxygen-independent coproporphyrinogen III oxidase [Candidatus Lindowbacteria bacterium RIFCSPLOWO2_12_FULL_62_27]OGH62229.1 MAG: oxygen-independent coproporphyrinogen III oxidase [Candidatus Lindowbacteria bacterium RIFCSPLOWO2_02_FULL_62_12]
MNLNPALIEKYSVIGPYYSSYPPLGEWKEDFRTADFEQALGRFCAEDTPAEPNTYAFYAHYPYCIQLCYFCLCNMRVTQDKAVKERALRALAREIDYFRRFIDAQPRQPVCKEIHLGGGTPSFMDNEDFDGFIAAIKSLVDTSTVEEFAMEIDPRTVTPESITHFATKGINRISFGIQDFNPRVQEAVNRVQPLDHVRALLSPEIRNIYKSVNFDILYGLPLQTRQTFRETIGIVKELMPERITLIRYAHVPGIKKHMKLLNEADILSEKEKVCMFIETVESLLDAGYEHVGIDNFAKPTDSLGKAFRNKTVWRNFSGFTPGRVKNMIGVGPSATSIFSGIYSQNIYDIGAYHQTVERGQFPPLERGYRLRRDDLIRREVILRIACDNDLDFDQIGEKFGIEFHTYFKDELQSLDEFVNDGLVERNGRSLTVTPLGRFFVRHVCKVFDGFLKSKTYQIHGT